MNAIEQTYALGQSFWLDYIRRDLFDSGELAQLIEAGEIRGVTSNPTIFQQAIGDSELYNAAMRPMAHAGWSAARIFETLAIEDIRAATDLFLPIYEGTGGKDGFVSIEVNPELANDTQATLEEARRLWEAVNRPNLMVKIPATAEGIPAIEQSLYGGVNINVTLIFSLERYSQVMEAYVRALERRQEEGEPLEQIASVASFFVSRVDSAADGRLEVILREEGPNAARAVALQGKAAIANAKLAYAQFKAVFEGTRFERLSEVGARYQRPLWASTSTKNPAYSDVQYVDELIGPHTVNTLPPKTLDAFRDHGQSALKLEQGLSDSRAQLDAMEALGISMAEITQELEIDGVRKFADSFVGLLDTVTDRAAKMRREIGPLAPALRDLLLQLDADRAAARFSSLSLWEAGKKSSALRERLAWLDLDFRGSAKEAGELAQGIDEPRVGWIGDDESLPVIQEATQSEREMVVLETLDPVEQRSFAKRTPTDSTLFVVASTEDSDVPTRAKLRAIWQRARNRLGSRAGRRFVALARPHSEIGRLAHELGFRQMMETQPGPLSSAQLFQAALLGGEPAELLEGALAMKGSNSPGVEAARNPGLYLGAILAAAVEVGRGSIHLIADHGYAVRARWLARLVEARTQLSIRAEAPQDSELDRAVVIYLKAAGTREDRMEGWLSAEAPVVVLEIEPGLRGIGADAVRWEVASGVAAHLLVDKAYTEGPYVSDSHRLSEIVRRHAKRGTLGVPKPTWDSRTVSLWWAGKGLQFPRDAELDDLAVGLLEQLARGSTLHLGIYHRRSRAAVSLVSRFQEPLAELLRVRSNAAFGRMPRRYLGSGFSMLVGVEPEQDEVVPELGLTFGALFHATMMADFETLKRQGGPGCALHIKSPGVLGEWFLALEAATTRLSEELHAETRDGKLRSRVADPR